MVLKRSIRLISEMKTFVFKNGRPDHMEGYHDILMSCAMALWAIEYSFKSLERLEKQTKAMLGGWVAGSPTATVTDIERGNGFVPIAGKNIGALPKPKFSH
jgi:hypothetical protein